MTAKHALIYHYLSMEDYMGIPVEEVEQNGQSAELASDAASVLEEYLASHDYIKLDGEQRILIHE